MIYIGLDQSSHINGYEVMNDHKLLDYGIYKASNKKEVMSRVGDILQFIEYELIWKYKKQDDYIIGLEDTQESRQNVNTFQLLTRVLGAIEYWLYNNDHPYLICHVSSWRSQAGVKGKRREDKKKSAIAIVEQKYNIKVPEDAAEAILITEYLRSQTGWKST